MDTSNFKEVFESPKVKELTAQVAALEAEVLRLRDVIFDMAGEEPGISWGKAYKVLSTQCTPTARPELIEKSLAELSALKTENEELRNDAEWQPIETAPKDGSHFIGAEFLDDKWWYEEIWWSYSWKFSGGNFLTYPTHWKPLPKPPAMAQGEK